VTDAENDVIDHWIAPYLPGVRRATEQAWKIEGAPSWSCVGDLCGATAELVERYLRELGIEATAYMPDFEGGGGVAHDESHAYIVLYEGTVIDPTIRQYLESPAAPEVQKRAAFGYPHVEGFPEIAVVPPTHPFIRKIGYESHTTGKMWLHGKRWEAMKDFGDALKELLHSDEAYAIIDRHPEIAHTTWMEGSCPVLAAALVRWFPGFDLVYIADAGTVHHALVRWGFWYFDADGASTEPELLRRWREEEGLSSPRIIDMVADDLEDFACPEGAVEEVHAFLREGLGEPHTYGFVTSARENTPKRESLKRRLMR